MQVTLGMLETMIRRGSLVLLPSLAAAQSLPGHGPPAPDPAEAYDEFGSALATGDFDGDGVGDLAVGVPGERISGAIAAGAVQVFYGQPGVGPLLSHSALWHQESLGVPGSAEPHDKFGSAVAAGDFDDDGYDDLAIGVPGEDFSGIGQAGMVQVLYGSGNGITAARNQMWHQNIPGIAGGAEPGDYFGDALAVGDFNFDGFDDLVIGTPREAVGNATDSGVVQVIYGAYGVGLAAEGDQMLYQGMTGLPETPETFDYFGAELTVGDFDGDGLDDLAIGAPTEDLEDASGSYPGAGVVHTLFGTLGGFTGVGNQMLSTFDEGISVTVPDTGRFGQGLAAGDLDGDGMDDLAIGSTTDFTTTTRVGFVFVYYSDGASGFDRDDVQTLSQDTPGIGGVAETGDLFGAELATGDFDVDGVEDLAVGVPHEGIGSLVEAGAVNVIYGVLGVGLTAAGDQVLYQNVPDIEGTSHWFDHFGAALVAGDLDGDGWTDLSIGVPGDNPDGIDDAGAVNVLFSAGYYGLVGIDDLLLHQFVWEIL